MRFRLMSKSTTLNDLKGPLRTVLQNTCVFRSPLENLNEDRLHCQRRRCSPMTLDSDDIRFMRIIAGVPWKWDVIQQLGNRKRVFSGVRTLRIRHLRKWGQHYYTALFSSLSPFHWSQNITRDVTSGEVREVEYSKQWSAERQNICNLRKICGSSVNAISSELGTLTNNASIILLSALSPFHWLQNTRLWMNLNRRFS